MAVGITILSGARQGERLELDAAEFRAGGRNGCQVFFDGRDGGAGASEALFQLGDDGWTLKNAGSGDVLVNGRPVEGRSRLRSGDVVRLSPSGPEFSFNLLARLSAPSPAAPSGEAAENDGFTSDSGQGTRRTVVQFAAALVVGLVVVVGLVAGLNAWRGGGDDVAVVHDGDPSRDAKKSGDESPQSKESGNELPQAKESGDESPHSKRRRETNDDDDPPSAAQAPQDPWDAAGQRLREAVFLLAVEQPKTHAEFPFATATAIGQTTLLTSATVALELARFRQRGWKLWAINSNGTKIEVAESRVHAGFERTAGKPDVQIYADLGLATLAGPCPHAAELASEQDLDALDHGQPLACLGIVHDSEPMNRFQSYAPEMTRGKVFVITSLPPSPGGPRLLHLRMTLAAKVYGAPVVNEAGRVVGVFAESAQPPSGQAAAELNLHYVPVVEPAQLRAWLERRDEAWWLPPTVPAEKAEEKPAAP